MFEVEANKSVNLLKIHFSGSVGSDEALRCVEQIPQLLATLKPGFRLLTDLSDLASMDVGCAPHIERTMDLCNARGLNLVVRIIPDPHKDIGLSIMSLFHYRPGIRIVTVATPAEAMEVLAR